MTESGKEKVILALETLSKTCQGVHSALRAATFYGQVEGAKEIASTLRNDAISIQRLIYSNTTRLSIALGKPPLSYDAALVSIKDLDTEVGQLVSCVSLIGSGILRREIAWAAEETVQALLNLSQHFSDKCQRGVTDEEYLAKTGAVHEAVRKAEDVSEDEYAAFAKTWKLNSEGLKDSLDEVKQMLEEEDSGDTELDKNDGWDDALGDSLPKLSGEELTRVKKLYPLFRFTTLFHDKILTDYIPNFGIEKASEGATTPLSSLLTFSNSLLVSNDDLASALSAPQDVDNIRECADLVMGVVHDLDVELGITDITNPTANQLAKRLKDLSLGSNDGSSAKWFQKCLQQIRKIYDTLSLDN